MKQVKTLSILLSFIFIMAFGAKAQQNAVPVFTSGEDGYKAIAFRQSFACPIATCWLL